MTDRTAKSSVVDKVLVSNAEDKITLADSCNYVEVASDPTNTTKMYFTVDGTAASVAGDNMNVVPPGYARVVPVPSGPTVVRLISSGTPTYSVSEVKV